MASSNAGPITGSELIRAVQDSQTVYLTRPQVASLLAFTALVSPRASSFLTEKTGDENFRAVQGTQRIEMNAADLLTYLAGTATPQEVPRDRQPAAFTGRERLVVRQGGMQVPIDLSQVLYVRGLGGSLGGVVDIGGGTPTPTPGPTTTNIIVTNRLDYPNTSVSLNTDNTARREHYAASAGAITDLRPVFKWNFFNGTTTGSGAAASLRHYLEYPEGVLHPVKWNGSDILTTAANGDYIADVVYTSVGNGPPLEIPAGAKYWEQTTYISNSSRVFPAISHAAPPATLGISDGKVAGGAGGTIPPDTSSLISWGMAAMMGTIKAANAVAYISIVDSLGIGQNDATGVGAKSSSGMVARSIDPLYPHARVGRGGYSAQDFVTMLGGVSFPNFFGNIRATHLLVEVGLNDLSLNSRTAAQVMADRQTIIDIITSKIPGIVPVHTTLTPRVDTTDNYSSLAGQTPKTDGNMADLTPFNVLARAKPKFMDFADATMSARDSKIFGGPFPFGSDPTHMNTPKIADAASKVSVPT